MAENSVKIVPTVPVSLENILTWATPMLQRDPKLITNPMETSTATVYRLVMFGQQGHWIGDKIFIMNIAERFVVQWFNSHLDPCTWSIPYVRQRTVYHAKCPVWWSCWGRGRTKVSTVFDPYPMVECDEIFVGQKITNRTCLIGEHSNRPMTVSWTKESSLAQAQRAVFEIRWV